MDITYCSELNNFLSHTLYHPHVRHWPLVTNLAWQQLLSKALPLAVKRVWNKQILVITQ